jgi:hypothetical protein
MNKRDYRRREWVTPLLKTPAEILVHQNLKKVCLYLFSLHPRISEVIIQKNAEPDRNNSVSVAGMGEVIFSDITVIYEGE